MPHAHIWQLVQELVARIAGPRAALDSIQTTPLRGGISAGEVVAVLAAYLDATGRRRAVRVVVKQLRGAARREVAIYRQLEAHHVSFMPRVLACSGRGDTLMLVLEHVTPVGSWPWRNTAHGEAVLRVVAELHRRAIPRPVPWDYDRELQSSAAETLAVLATVRQASALHVDAASLRAVRRVACAISSIRREVVLGGPFPSALIHGDLHPGNVLLSQRAGGQMPVLLDWGRARVGSPLEDVASWIQSLGCWEPAARKRHDSLLAAYLRARGGGMPIATHVRKAYWLAGASNAMAGALLHHVGVATSRSASRSARASALVAVHDWLRIIRRAEAMWLEPERAPRRARDRRTAQPHDA